jgi:hypothetical protein
MNCLKIYYNHPSVYIISTYIVWPQTQANLYTQCWRSFELPKSHNQDFTHDHIVEIQKQSIFEGLRNLSLSLRRRPQGFQIWPTVLESLKLASRCLRTLIQIGSEHQQKEWELWECLLRGDPKEEQIFVSPDHSVWFLQFIFSDSRIADCIVGHWRSSRWPVHSSKGSASSLSHHMSFHIFVHVS